jgi:pimeloyl-ACP methyl ester carboxylesterase
VVAIDLAGHGHSDRARTDYTIEAFGRDVTYVSVSEAGFDDILYDYVRRPDGSLDGMRIPGLDGTPEEGIVRFFSEVREQLAQRSVIFALLHTQCSRSRAFGSNHLGPPVRGMLDRRAPIPPRR